MRHREGAGQVELSRDLLHEPCCADDIGVRERAGFKGVDPVNRFEPAASLYDCGEGPPRVDGILALIRDGRDAGYFDGFAQRNELCPGFGRFPAVFAELAGVVPAGPRAERAGHAVDFAIGAVSVERAGEKLIFPRALAAIAGHGQRVVQRFEFAGGDQEPDGQVVCEHEIGGIATKQARLDFFADAGIAPHIDTHAIFRAQGIPIFGGGLVPFDTVAAFTQRGFEDAFAGGRLDRQHDIAA